MLFLHQNIITKTSFMCDLIISHGSAWPRGTLPTFLHFMSCQQAASGVTPSERERCLTWISFIALTSPAAAKTARSYCRRSALWKNNSGRSWYKYISSCSRPPKLFICVFIFFLEPQSSLCKGCLCLWWSCRTAQLSVKCWDTGSGVVL